MDPVILTSNGMDLVFNTKDVIYIISIVIMGMTGWFKLQRDKDRINNRVDNLEQKRIEAEEKYIFEVMDAKNGRIAIKKEFSDSLKEIEQILHKRIDKTQQDQKRYSEKIDGDIKELGSQFNELDKKMEKGFAEVLAEIKNLKQNK